jgi:peptide-methionine (R)-S-oxide reductase
MSAFMDPKQMTDADWRERLSPEAYHVLREHGTERAFSGKFNVNKADGIYACSRSPTMPSPSCAIPAMA